MAVEVHVANIGLLHVDTRTGEVYTRSSGSRSIQENLHFDTQHRVLADDTIPNTSNNPDIKTYLELEAASDFQPVQIFQSLIITKKVT